MTSELAARLVSGAPAIAEAHFKAEARPYHPRHDPDGYLNLGTAEHRLVWDLLAPQLAKREPPRAADYHYAPLHGTHALRAMLAPFLGKLFGAALDAEDLVVVSGASAALDIVASALCNPGDAIVVPAPYYAAFDVDLGGRSGARLVPAPSGSATEFRLAPQAIERVIIRLRREGTPVRAIALTSPSNPVGHVYELATLRELADVAARHQVDLISDEIYAGSAFGTNPFVSLLDERVGSRARVHVVWGFAKDFGLSGLKVGVLCSPHADVRAAARALAYFAPTSTDTQALLRNLLADAAWVEAFAAEHRKRVGHSCAQAMSVLEASGIPFVPAQAGFSLWIDLRHWLSAPSFEAEAALWRTIFETTRVSILPGAAFASPEPGWFRLCHTMEPATVAEAIGRVGQFLRSAAKRS
jgi:aspartate/methionine/tyrosine aminotransferase